MRFISIDNPVIDAEARQRAYIRAESIRRMSALRHADPIIEAYENDCEVY